MWKPPHIALNIAVRLFFRFRNFLTPFLAQKHTHNHRAPIPLVIGVPRFRRR